MILGVVESIARFPVKSMRAESLETGELRWMGLHGDRQYAFVRGGNHSRFPWLTGREVPDLVLHEARYGDPAEPRNAAVSVRTPEGEVFAIDDPVLTARLAEKAGEPVHMMQVGRGCFDAMPVSVISTATADAVAAAYGTPLSLDRFRINIVVRAEPGAGRESEWLGRTLRFGNSVEVNLGWGIPRCSMVNIDPGTATRDPSVLRTINRDFDNQIGAYGSVGTPGTIGVGDVVRLVR
jgi:uncharacterized protein